MSVTPDYLGMSPNEIQRLDMSDPAPTGNSLTPQSAVTGSIQGRATGSSMGPRARVTPGPEPIPVPIAQAMQNMAGPPSNASPLVQYFVSMGINPQTAVQLTSRVATMEQPSPPLANGIKIAPHDAVAQMLQAKYGMRPDQAANLAKQYTDMTAPKPATKSDK